VTAAYLSFTQEQIEQKLEAASLRSTACDLCPRTCLVDRLADQAGVCGLGKGALISSINLHHGEEPPISGTGGSGTIFFSGCNLACVFCQNYPISQLRHGRPMTSSELAAGMLDLQGRGAHNINLVTPSHAVWPFLEAFAQAVKQGLEIPIVYNTSAYDSVETLALLDGIVDIYMPDLKYADDAQAKRLSQADDYWQIATRAILEMHRQVGFLETDQNGVAKRGLILRHLVLPGGLAGTERVLEFLKENLGGQTSISLMRQYFPANRALELPPLDRPLRDDEFKEAKELLERFELDKGWIQE
jgi:putative pyruvate formate lyase activating enzyme